MHHLPMYEIWWSRGQGSHTGPRFKKLEDALHYVHEHRGRASFAIKHPGGWYRYDRAECPGELTHGLI